MNSQEQRKIDFEHLKLMIDVQRHMAVMSLAGLVLAANILTRPDGFLQNKVLVYISIAGFFICIVSSILSQFNHIDASKNKVIYTYPLTYKFGSPIAFSMLGLLSGVFSLAAFILSTF
jgi:hypothetical protein